jgi:hypothetical protein
VHFRKAKTAGGAQAVAAGTIFNFNEHKYPPAKRQMQKEAINIG